MQALELLWLAKGMSWGKAMLKTEEIMPVAIELCLPESISSE